MYSLMRNDVLTGANSTGQIYEQPDTIKIPRPAPAVVSSQQCRVCLQQGLIPIYSQKNYFDYSVSYYLTLICNIDISVNDSFPQYLCKTCFNTLDSSIKLRKTAMTTQLHFKFQKASQKMTHSFKETNQIKCGSGLIILSPVQKKGTKNETKDIVQRNNGELLEKPISIPLKKTEIDSDIEEIDPFENDCEPIFSPLHKEETESESEDEGEDNENPMRSSMHNEESNSESDNIDQGEYNEEPMSSPLHKEEIENESEDIDQREDNEKPMPSSLLKEESNSESEGIDQAEDDEEPVPSHLHEEDSNSESKEKDNKEQISSSLRIDKTDNESKDTNSSEPVHSSLKKEETDNTFRDIDLMEQNCDEPIPFQSLQENSNSESEENLPLFQIKEINEKNKEKHKKNNPKLPTLTLDVLKQLKAKKTLYPTYFEKIITTDKKCFQCRICKKRYIAPSISRHLISHLADWAGFRTSIRM